MRPPLAQAFDDLSGFVGTAIVDEQAGDRSGHVTEGVHIEAVSLVVARDDDDGHPVSPGNWRTANRLTPVLNGGVLYRRPVARSR